MSKEAPTSTSHRRWGRLHEFQDIWTDGIVPIDSSSIELIDLIGDMMRLPEDDIEGSTLYRWIFDWKMGTKFEKGMIRNEELPETDPNREPDLTTIDNLYDYLAWEGTAHPREIGEEDRKSRFVQVIGYARRRIILEDRLREWRMMYDRILCGGDIPQDIGDGRMIELLEDWIGITPSDGECSILSWWWLDTKCGILFKKEDARWIYHDGYGEGDELDLYNAGQMYDYLVWLQKKMSGDKEG